MDDTGNPTQNGQHDVDQEVGATSALQENTQRRQDDGEEDFADVSVEIESVIMVRRVRQRLATGPTPFRRPSKSRQGKSHSQLKEQITYEAVKGMLAVVLKDG